MSLKLEKEGARLTVRGDAFEIEWDGDAGGEIAEIRQHDGDSWFRVNAANFGTMPGLVLTRDGRDSDARSGRSGCGPLRVLEMKPDREGGVSIRELEKTENGSFETEVAERFGYRGYKLIRGD